MPDVDRPERRVIGTCPECDAAIDARQRLIAYRRAGEPTCYAECVACRAVITPT